MTDSDGAFAFDQLTFDRNYSISAHSGDLYASPTMVRLREQHESIILHLRIGSTLVLHVFADRAPLPDAKFMVNQSVAATTDADGVATIRGLGPQFLHGWLVAPGRAQELVKVFPGGAHDVTQCFITLQPGVEIEGTVLGLLGMPVSGVEICLQNVTDERVCYTACSDTYGRWHVDACPGAYRVLAKSNFLAAELTTVCELPIRQRDTQLRLRFSLENTVNTLLHAGSSLVGTQPGRIAGIVRDQTGRPIVGAYVHALERDIIVREATTDWRGRFDFDELRAETYNLSAAWVDPRQTSNAVRGRLARVGDTNLELVLPPGGTVTGRVVLDDKPLSYYGVYLLRDAQSPIGCTPIGISSDDGRFTLKNADPGRRRLAIRGEHTRLRILDGIVIEPGKVLDVGDIRMDRGQRISGTVRDAIGMPVERARVIISHNFGMEWEGEWSRLQQWFSGYFETITDAFGAYVLEGIDTSTSVRRPIICAKHVDAGESVIHELSDGCDETIDFELRGAGRIVGVVEGIIGGRVSALAVRANEPSFARSAIVDNKGRFQFMSVPPGDYLIRLNVRDSAQASTAQVSVAANGTAFATLMLKNSIIQLTLRVPQQQGTNLVIESIDGDPVGGWIGVATYRDEDRCHIDNVSPGRYRVSFDGTTWIPISVSASPANQTVDVRHFTTDSTVLT